MRTQPEQPVRHAAQATLARLQKVPTTRYYFPARGTTGQRSDRSLSAGTQSPHSPGGSATKRGSWELSPAPEQSHRPERKKCAEVAPQSPAVGFKDDERALPVPKPVRRAICQRNYK